MRQVPIVFFSIVISIQLTACIMIPLPPAGPQIGREEIETLKADKAHSESSLNRLRGDHEKVVNENRILKRAVTIQQERQNQATNELGAARRFKLDAEERIKKLEAIASGVDL